jgi:DMSO reductase anchor subunit
MHRNTVLATWLSLYGEGRLEGLQHVGEPGRAWDSSNAPEAVQAL